MKFLLLLLLVIFRVNEGYILVFLSFGSSLSRVNVNLKLLYLKSDNNLYNSRNNTEEKNGILDKGDLINLSLIVNERAKEKAKISTEENLIDIDLLKGSFGTRQNKITMKMKSAMSSVIKDYINERKKQTEKEKLVNKNKIKKDNEKKLFYLDDSINNINNEISKIKYLVSNSK